MHTNTHKLLPGNKLAKARNLLSRELITALKKRPVLKIVQVGQDPASTLYVAKKVEFAVEVGIDAEAVKFAIPETAEQIAKIKQTILRFNEDPTVDGIMIQSPILGLDMDQSLEIFNAITVTKDVDGLTASSLGLLWQLKTLSQLQGFSGFISATPAGVIDALLWYAVTKDEKLKALVSKDDELESMKQILKLNWSQKEYLLKTSLKGKNALIINRSNIVGKPLASLLLMCDLSVEIVHSHSKDIENKIKNADIILTATGEDHIFRLSQFHKGQMVIDIGISSSDLSSKVKGDVLVEEADVEFLSAVPGGVGPLTVANLLSNTVFAAQRK
jgi:methylenetetrahydrofolate dehydrogenase (NADP+)/methenyltetrahydrofolate cyclohydrolase